MAGTEVVNETATKLSTAATILSKFCRDPSQPEAQMPGVVYDLDGALDTLERAFPDLKQRMANKVVVDYGSGFGYQSIACALAGAKRVIGVESDPQRLESAEKLLQTMPELKDKVTFMADAPADASANLIFSQNAFEHFLDPEQVIESIAASLAPNGRVLIGFGPPWWAPTGAHMTYFCKIPWIQLFFSEKTIMQVRSFYRADGYGTYAEAGLGELSIAKFEQLIGGSNLECRNIKYRCIKGLDFLQRTPLRELFINYVQCELRKPL